MRGRYERERWDDHLSRHADRSRDDFQRYGRIAHRHTMLHSQHFGDSSLEFLHALTIVREPSPVNDLVDAGEQPLPIADVGLANVEMGAECGRSTENSERAGRADSC